MRCLSRSAIACAIVGLAVGSVTGQTFQYSTDFNSDTVGALPPGWTAPTQGVPAGALASVMDADPASWGTPCAGGGGNPAGCGALGILQDYTVAWSGGKRLNLIHPAQAPLTGWAAAVWYDGTDSSHTGSYPLDLQNNSLRVRFDMIVRTGDDRCGPHPADGGTFAVMPVTNLATDLTRIGSGGGGMGWGGLPGFAVEFDVWDNGNPDTNVADSDNHLGLNSLLGYDIDHQGWRGEYPGRPTGLEGEDQVYSLAKAGGLPAKMWTIGDNNQPLHFTIYYNDPAEGGAGVVRVYLLVKASDYPGSGGIGSPFSFGEASGHPDGQLILESCIGAFPTAGAIVGFTAGVGGCNSVYQIDNVSIETYPAAGTPCTLPPRTFTPGLEVALNEAGAVPGGDPNLLSTPGWDVTTYRTFAGDLNGLKNSINWATANGFQMGQAVGVSTINFEDSGCGGNIPGGVRFPGYPAGFNTDNDNMGMLAKGWIYFPPGDGYPRHYNVAVNSDDGFELVIGTNPATGDQVIMDFPGGRGCGGGPDAGTFRDLIVPGPGIYPIQLLWFEGGGGAGCEFYRRVPTESLLLIPPMTGFGDSPGPFSDMPLVYSLYNGQPAPDLKSRYLAADQFAPPAVVLSPSQKVAGVGTGSQVFDVKTIKATYPGIDMRVARDDAGDVSALRFLDALNNLAPGATSAVINFREPGQGSGPIPGGSNFPPFNAVTDQFGFRAQGFITFPAPGFYALGMDSDDESWVRIGDQTIYSANCCPHKQFTLYVSEAGTYPIRVEMLEGGGDARVDFYEIAPGIGGVSVNHPSSRLTVHNQATSGSYAWRPNGTVIPGDRRVADVGGGGTLGWNAILAKAPPGVTIDANMGLATALIENDLVGAGVGVAEQAFDLPDFINYADINEGGGRFGGDRSMGEFRRPDNTPYFTAGGNEDFAISANGFIEFPAPGDYALGTNGDDGMIMWIAGKVVTVFPFNTGPADNTPAVVHVDTPGLYDIRVDYFERGGGAEMEVFQYLPDGSTRVLVNDPAATVKVYRTLGGGALTDEWHNPVRIPASAKAALAGRGIDPGFRVQVVNATFLEGNGDGGIGHEKLHSLDHASELLDAVTGVAPSLSQFGALVSDSIQPVINFPDNGGAGTGYPGPPNNEDFAVRATGYLDLKKGGHLFEIPSDDGFIFTMAGKVVGKSGALKGASAVRFYVHVEEDGLYPFTLDHFERGSGNSLVFNEIVVSGLSFTIENVNTGSASKAYANVLPCGFPFADGDGDGDVDGVDFGLLQACYTGPVGGPIPGACICFDTGARDGKIDSVDLAEFFKCATGPEIPWSQAITPDCVP
ncbi:MAG: hypothetical protein HRF43_09980 [Phycisphaerae bacterium]